MTLLPNMRRRALWIVAAGVAAALFVLLWPRERQPVSRRAPDRAPWLTDGGETAGSMRVLAVRVAVEPPTASQWKFTMRFLDAAGVPSQATMFDRSGDGPRGFTVPWPDGARRGVARLSYGDGNWQEIVVDPPLPEEVTFLVREPWMLDCKVRSVAGTPLAGVNVTLSPREAATQEARTDRHRPPNDVEGRTNESGELRLSGLDSSVSYDLAAVVTGHQVARLSSLNSGPGTARVLDLVLEPGGRIIGTLMESNGRPAAGVNLTIERVARQVDGSTEWATEGEMVAAAGGGFVCECLSAGHKKVVGTSRYERGLTTLVQFTAEVFPGRTTDVGVITVRGGMLEIHVKHADGSPVHGARIRLVAVPASGVNVPGDVIIAYVFADQEGVARVAGVPAAHLDLLVVDETKTAEAFEPARVSMDYDGNDVVRDVVCGRKADSAGGHRLRIRLKDPARKAVFFAVAGSRLISSAILGTATSDRELGTEPTLGEDIDVYFVQKGKYGHKRVGANDVPAGEVCELTADLDGVDLWVRVVGTVGTPLRRATVLLGTTGQRDADWIELGFTDEDGRFSIEGLPTDRKWFITARTESGFTQVEEWRQSRRDQPIELQEAR